MLGVHAATDNLLGKEHGLDLSLHAVPMLFVRLAFADTHSEKIVRIAIVYLVE